MVQPFGNQNRKNNNKKRKNLTYAYDCLLYQLGMKISLLIGIAPRARRSPHTYHCFKITEGEDHIFN